MTKRAVALFIALVMVVTPLMIVDSDVDAANDNVQSIIGDAIVNGESTVVVELSAGTYDFGSNWDFTNIKSLTVKAAPGSEGKVIVDLANMPDDDTDNTNTKIASIKTKRDPNATLTIEGIKFTSNDFIVLAYFSACDVRFNDCDFENIQLQHMDGGNDDPALRGKTAITGCNFMNVTEKGMGTYALILLTSHLIFTDNEVSGCAVGASINMNSDTSGDAIISGNRMHDISSNRVSAAFFIGGTANSVNFLFEENVFSSTRYGISFYYDLNLNEQTKVTLRNNSMACIDGDILYREDGNGNYPSIPLEGYGNALRIVTLSGAPVDESLNRYTVIEEEVDEPVVDDDDSYTQWYQQQLLAQQQAQQQADEQKKVTYVAIAAGAVAALMALMIVAIHSGKL